MVAAQPLGARETVTGARGVLVPTDRTLQEEVRDAPEVARDLSGAVRLLLGEPA